MSYVFCNKCGHRNPPISAFCSACGAVLDIKEDHTITLSKVDPLQDAIGDSDDVHVDLDDIPAGRAILVVRGGEDSHICLDDITVSRQHSEIHESGGRYIVRDSGSLNGTYVNHRRIDVAELAQGDELQVGKYRLVFLESIEDLK